MFWEYRSDRSGALLDTLDAALRGVDVLPLSGVWRFALDPKDEGLSSSWDGRVLADRIRLPGVLQAQGIGDDVTVDTRWTGQIVDRSFFTSPRYAPVPPAREHQGAVLAAAGQGTTPGRRGTSATWTVPAAWAGPARRAPPRAAALGDARRGSTTGSSARTTASRTPHEYDLGTALAPGPHRLTIRVDNRLVVDVGRNSHSVTRPHAGQLERHRRPDRAAATERRSGSTTCRCSRTSRPRPVARARPRSATRTGQPGAARVRLRGRSADGPAATPLGSATVDGLTGTRDGGAFETRRARSGADAGSWDEFSPGLLPADATLETARGPRHADGHASACARSRRAARSSRSTAAAIFLRGTLECASSRRPAIRRPTSRRGSAIIRDREGARPEPHPLPLVVPARGGLRGGRRAGLLLPGRGRLVAERLDAARRRPAGRRLAVRARPTASSAPTATIRRSC